MSVEISNNQKNLSFSGLQPQKWKRALKYIDLTPNSPVSDAFVKEMAQGIASAGITGQKTIKGQKTRFVLAQKASDICPDLKGRKCPGWPEGTTWDNTPALCYEKTVGFLEKPVGGQKVDIGDVRHEVGHQLDNLFETITTKSGRKRPGALFTATKGYTEAYLKDIKNLPENMKKYGEKVKDADFFMDYIIQKSTPKKADDYAKKEAFAEIYADFNGGGYQETASKGMAELHRQVFPNTVAYIEKLLYLMGKRN